MSNRWKGNFIIATEATSSGTDFTGKANGNWSLNNQLQQKQANLWSKAVYAPNAPTIGTASQNSSSSISITFTGSTDAGGGTITSYTATSTPGGITGTATSSPIIVTNLTTDISYTFTVHANSSLGYTSSESSASNSVTLTSNPTSFIAIAGSSSTPSIAVYPWNTSTGAGVKYSDPATVVTGAQQIAFNFFQATGTAIYVSNSTTPFIHGYPWNNGFGTKFSNPSTLPENTINKMRMNTAGTCLSTRSSNKSAKVYKVSPTGFVSYLGSPSLSGLQGFTGSGFNATDSLIGYGGYTTSSVKIFHMYSWNNEIGFGSKFADPSTLPPGGILDITSNSDSTIIFACSENSPGLLAYDWSDGFGTKYANPTGIGSDGTRVSFDNTNSKIAVAVGGSPYVQVYDWSGGFGSKIADPSTLPASYAAQSVTFNYNNNTIAVSTGFYNPSIYNWSSSGFGSKYADISGNPTGSACQIAFSGV